MGRPPGTAQPVVNAQCPICPRVLPTRAGRNYHLSTVHADVQEVLRQCRACDEFKGLEEFPPVSGHPGKRQYRCYVCKNSANDVRKRVRPEDRTAAQRRDRRKTAREKFGLTLEEYDEAVARFFEEQDGKCPGCGVALDAEGVRWHLDHDHETMELRGLLCSYCNIALGQVRDSVATLLALVAYLTDRNHERIVVLTNHKRTDQDLKVLVGDQKERDHHLVD